MRPRTIAASTAAVGLGAAAARGAIAQRRAVRRIRSRPDPYADEPFGTLRGRPVRVRAGDGVTLHAEIDNEDRTDLALVFSHGWALTQDSWHFQRKALRDAGRLVFWDQRGHGRSGHGVDHTMGRLGADLAAVIDATVPAGTPVVLIGHSMGGMTIMMYADRHPEAFGERIIGVGLVCTSSGNLNEVRLGVPAALSALARRALPRAVRTGVRAAPLLERCRRLTRQTSMIIEDRVAFGPGAGPSTLAFCERMMADTRLDAFLEFFGAMTVPGSFATLKALAEVPTTVIGAEHDVITPLGHSLTIAAAVPGARLEVVSGAGHMAMIERPGVVNAHLRELIANSTR